MGCRPLDPPTVPSSMMERAWGGKGSLLGFSLFLWCLVLRAFGADTTVVFNELHYFPAGGAGSDAVEWVEFHNQMAVDMEVGGWSLGGGVDYTFPPGTIVPGRGFLVVSGDPETLRSVTGLPSVLGPWAGRLSNEGERIVLRSANGRVMDELRYGVVDPWPVACQGTGSTLAKRTPQSSGASPENWTGTGPVGGTPGAPNPPDPGAERSSVRWSEVSGFGETPFRIEGVNPAGQMVSIAGSMIRGIGRVPGLFVFPEGAMVPAHGRFVVDAATLGWTPGSEDLLVFLSPGGRDVLDAVRVGSRGQGRRDDRSDDRRWYRTSRSTWGETNAFRFREEIVLNEIQYRPRPRAGRPAEYRETTLIPLEAEWRFDSSGREPAGDWRGLDFDDSRWSRGRAALYVETADLPVAKNTPLTLGRTTYYFRTRVVFEGDPDGAELVLTPLVDDGAVFHLNGGELGRMNMAEGEVGYGTYASVGVSDATLGPPLRFPATMLRRGTNVIAVEVHQAAAGSSDVVFALGVVVSERVSPEVPPGESTESWVELYHRGDQAVDLGGWQLVDGIRFRFPSGTLMNPGEYLVVARDAAGLRALHPGVRILGDFEGRLSAKTDLITLLDSDGVPADEVRYFDRKPWPSSADGGGSTLELRDPRADNRRPEAWAASDEDARTVWKTYGYTATARSDGGPTRWNEFVVGLLDDGTALVDDFAVVEAPEGAARSLLTNGSFDGGAAGWRFLGNHRGSAIVPDPDHPDDPAKGVLRLVASGPTEHMHNHLETTLVGNQPVVNGRTYRVSFRAKPVSGSPRLNTRLYFSRVSRTTVLETPTVSGTPGARNSRFVENLGPTFDRLRHAPVVPAAAESVTVSASVEDPDGVAVCRLWWSVGGGAWQSVAMQRSGAGSNEFSGSIPGQAAAAVVQFHLEAVDERGAISVYPAGGRNSRALYQVNDGQATNARLHQIRIVMTAADAAFQMATTNLMSNESLGGTILSDESEVFYDAGVRLQGSQRGRPNPSRVGYTLSFPADRLFRGVHDSVSLDRSGGYSGRGGRQDEIVARHIFNRAGGLPEMYNDLVHAVYPRSLEGRRNGVAQLLMAKYGDEFLDGAYPLGSDGGLFKHELIYYPTTSVANDPSRPKVPQPDEVIGIDFEDRGDDPEAYRWYFLIENRRADDDFTAIIRLARTLGSSGAALERQAAAVMDVDQWARAFAAKSLCGDVDTYGMGYPHNQMIYFRPSDGRALVFPWDLDFAWARSPTDSIAVGANLGRVLSFPANARAFYGHVLDLLGGSFNANYLGRWTTHYGQLAGQNYGGIRTYVTQRSAAARSQLPAQVPFRIGSGAAGTDTPTGLASVTLGGTAWIDVRRLEVRSLEPATNLVWTTVTNWRVTVPLVLGRNRIEVIGYGFDGVPLASNVVQVTTTSRDGGTDSDGDGLPDSWEVAAGLDPRRPEGGEDPDADGLANREEYLAGTAPRDSADRLTLAADRADGGLRLRFVARAGRRYELEARTSSGEGTWTTVAVIPPRLEDGELIHTESSGVGSGERFYRLVIR